MDDIKPPAPYQPHHVPVHPAPPAEPKSAETFLTPEQVANSESDKPAQEEKSHSKNTPNKLKPHHKLKVWWHRLNKKRKILLVAGSVLIIVGLAGALALELTKAPTKTSVATITKPKTTPKVAQPTTVPSTLTGLPVDPAVNQRPVTGVMVENSPDARPQSGLDQAGVVFEAVAEGGITRFLAIYQDTEPGYLGPVRSVRPYYIQWAQAFDAAIAHVGGSPEALQDMKSWGVKDLDQFYNGNFYQRITSRYAPHNVYTSLAQLNQLEASKGYGAATYSGFARKPDQPSKAPTATSIDFNPSSGTLYEAHYDYVAATNNYKRSEDGAPHMETDVNGTQTQITPKVVVALILQQGIESDDLHTSYTTVGSGQAYVFQDGTVTIGSWSKASNTAQIVLTNAQGKVIRLNAGQTWFTALGGNSSSYISYRP